MFSFLFLCQFAENDDFQIHPSPYKGHEFITFYGTMEYYAAIKNNEFVSFVGTWMNLDTIILSKLTQEQKIKHRMLSLTGGC